MTCTVFEGDCLEQMQIFDDNYFDSIVTDPPYGLSFMGKEWDHGIPGIPYWKEALRIVKPGAHMLAFGGTRTHHRLMCAIEDAGWEIRDTLMWVYGSGFPKSLDVSKAIDKAAGVGRTEGQREWKGGLRHSNSMGGGSGQENGTTTLLKYDTPSTDDGLKWTGWGTALKPAWEPIILCRKPVEGTIVQNVLTHGCGGINIDGSRVEIPENDKANYDFNNNGLSRLSRPEGDKLGQFDGGWKIDKTPRENTKGRFPANLIHDGSDEVVELFPITSSGAMKRKVGAYEGESNTGILRGVSGPQNQHGDSGSAARFFYCAKASKSERNIGCESLPDKTAGECTDRQEDTAGLNSPRAGAGRTSGGKNFHPTVKPLALLDYLCKLITPHNGLILDPFAGSGTLGLSANRCGFNSILIELDHDYAEIARRCIQ